MSMNEEEFASFLWALENTGLAWAVDDLRARDTDQREALAQMKTERDQYDELHLESIALAARHEQALARVEAERDAMEAMVSMLEEKEWAEHASKGPVSSRLETCITTLMNELYEANGRAEGAQVLVMTYAEQRDIAHAQLAEVLALYQKIRHVVVDNANCDQSGKYHAIDDAFMAIAQADQQEAQGPMAKMAEGLRQKAADEWASHPSNPANQEAQGAQAGEFQREDRYIVIKRKDLYTVPFEAREGFSIALSQLTKLLPKRECLVIESDWPEYEPAWAAIQARVEANAALGGDKQ